MFDQFKEEHIRREANQKIDNADTFFMSGVAAFGKEKNNKPYLDWRRNVGERAFREKEVEKPKTIFETSREARALAEKKEESLIDKVKRKAEEHNIKLAGTDPAGE